MKYKQPVNKKAKLWVFLEWFFLIAFFAGLWLAGYLYTVYPPQQTAPAQKAEPLAAGKVPVQAPAIALPPAEEVKPPAEAKAPVPPPAAVAKVLTEEEKYNQDFEEAVKVFEQKDLDQALVLFNQLLSRDPNVPEPYVYLGKISYVNKNYGEAFEFFGQALTFDPTHSEAHIGQSASLFKMAEREADEGRWDKAYRHLKEAKKFYPTTHQEEWDTLWGRVYSNWKVHENVRKFIESLAKYRNANQMFLKGWSYQLPNKDAGAYFFESKKEFTQALALIRKSKETMPENIRLLFEDALKERLVSTEIALVFSKEVSDSYKPQWDRSVKALERSNESVHAAANLFANYLDQTASEMLSNEELENSRTKLNLNLKGILVIQNEPLTFRSKEIKKTVTQKQA